MQDNLNDLSQKAKEFASECAKEAGQKARQAANMAKEAAESAKQAAQTSEARNKFNSLSKRNKLIIAFVIIAVIVVIFSLFSGAKSEKNPIPDSQQHNSLPLKVNTVVKKERNLLTNEIGYVNYVSITATDDIVLNDVQVNRGNCALSSFNDDMKDMQNQLAAAILGGKAKKQERLKDGIHLRFGDVKEFATTCSSILEVAVLSDHGKGVFVLK